MLSVSLKRLPAVLLVLCPILCQAQTPTGTISGRVVDQSSAVIQGAIVNAIDVETNARHSTETNSVGQFTIPNLLPGTYKLDISKQGFRTIVRPDIIVHVQDILALNFILPVGASSEIVTVEGDTPILNTQSASVSTVIDRAFAENLPMNGRSFQTLIQLTPGVVTTAGNAADSGQFAINGQRASSNYWMVDGVSANIGVGAKVPYGSALSGSVGSFSTLGGTNSLVSVDALQEFRIQTSTYAPEFGRTPGGQISILTRSGTNQIHGTAFDYLRNDALDANDWFNGFTNNPPLPKAKDRQNDFGGTISGPFLRNRTFFFFSYEGLRLRLPQTALTLVPDLNARQTASPAIQPYLNAYPLPNGANVGAGRAQFNSTFSNIGTLDAYSLRLDHNVSDRLTVFARYNYSPSELLQRGGNGFDPLSEINRNRINTQTATVGSTWSIGPSLLNDVRFNYSRTNASGSFYLDSFGGAVPVLPSLPSPYTTNNSYFTFAISSVALGSMQIGKLQENTQRQFNFVDSLSIQKGRHNLKAGIDFRRLSPFDSPYAYSPEVTFSTVPAAVTGNLAFGFVFSRVDVSFLFRNIGIFAQDTWRIIPRLTITYGVRWDIDSAPTTTTGPVLPAVTGFSLSDLSQLALAPGGTSPYRTRFGNFAPRVGLAYQIRQSNAWQTVLRGGFGVFYDLASSEVGDVYFSTAVYPFAASKQISGTFPLTSAAAAPPPIVVPNPGSGTLLGFDPQLKLPYTLEWNIAVEQRLGKRQSLSASYVGAAGRRLLQSTFVSSPNSNYVSASLEANTSTSDYEALQLQFQRQLAHNLQALASYSWSHSIDTASAGSFFNRANGLVPAIGAAANRGPSDFDVRNNFSAGLTYMFPLRTRNTVINSIASGWSVQNVVQARSALPVNVYDGFLRLNGASTQLRADLVPGVPLYLYGSQYPGGKIFNNLIDPSRPGCKGPFCPPPIANGVALREGNLGRNALRGFGATQWDLAVHRSFHIYESATLQFRAELFNVINHPNFGQPIGDITNSQFGRSTQTLARSLSANAGGGGLNALYQIGGPRSIQLALKFMF